MQNQIIIFKKKEEAFAPSNILASATILVQ
jgi:hypothetical protein